MDKVRLEVYLEVSSQSYGSRWYSGFFFFFSCVCSYCEVNIYQYSVMIHVRFFLLIHVAVWAIELIKTLMITNTEIRYAKLTLETRVLTVQKDTKKCK